MQESYGEKQRWVTIKARGEDMASPARGRVQTERDKQIQSENLIRPGTQRAETDLPSAAQAGLCSLKKKLLSK